MIRWLKERGTIIFGWVLIVTSLAYCVIVQYENLSRFLGWDEVDYAMAAKQGIFANTFERQSLTFIQLSKLGYAKIKRTEQDVKAYPIETSDPFQLRHFHHPLPVYYWHFFLNDDPATQDFLLRLSNIVLFVLCSLTILFFIMKIFLPSGEQGTFFLACIILPFFVASDLFLTSFSELNFHTFFFLAALLFLLSLSNYLIKPERNSALLLGISVAGVFCVLETSVFIYAGALLAIYITKQRNIFLVRAKTVFITFVISVLILWPGIIITLGPVKSWAMYVYRIFSAGNASYEQVSVLFNLTHIISSNLWLFLFTIFGYLGLLFFRDADKSSSRIFLLPALVGLFYGIVMLPFTLSDKYILPAAGLLFLGSLSGMIRWMKTSPKAKYILAAGSLLYVAGLYIQTDFRKMKNNSLMQHEKFVADLREMNNLLMYKQPLLVDGGRVFNYYIPGSSGYVSELFRISTHAAEFAIRKDYQYIRQDSVIQSKYYKGIVIGKKRNYSEEQFEKLKQWGYNFRELNNYYLFYR